jgi:L-asparaginase
VTERRHVHVLFTGGTISMRVDPRTGGALPALSGREILTHVPGLGKEARLTFEDYALLPGPHATPRWMWRLRAGVGELLADPDVDGVVITHGTDTLEETAFLLDLTLDSPKPVVLCGAMRTISDAGWDGPRNLRTAVRAAVHPASARRGVLITVGDTVHAAAEATKWHTQSPEAFRSPGGPLAVVDRGQIVFRRPVVRAARIPARRLVTAVDLHTMAAGVDGSLVRASLRRGARGLVIEGSGAGNVPPAVVPILRGAIRSGRPVVLVARCPEGRVTPIYGFVGGGLRLLEMGVILAPDLPGPKARIKLMVALGHTSDLAELRRIFDAG